MTPAQAATVLAGLPVTETLTTALSAQADLLVEAVRANLATPPGGPHDHPWRKSGELQASIAATADELSARVGSDLLAAVGQELGTATIPARPYFAPAASALAEPIARAIGHALADLLARRPA